MLWSFSRSLCCGRNFCLLLLLAAVGNCKALTIEMKGGALFIRGDQIPGGEIKVWYLEAYCRSNSTASDWSDTVIPHTNQVLSVSADKKRIRLRDTLADGLVVEHTIM